MPHSFVQDSYDTPEGGQDLASRLLLNCRFYFYLRTCFNFYRIGKCARQGRFHRQNQAYYSRLNFDLLERCGARIHLRGLQNLSAEPGPFVLAGNHMSSIETMILNAFVSPRLDFTFVIKRGLFSVPFLRQAMRAIGAIGVGQLDAREDFKIIMEQGCQRLQSGQSVLIFPEAARCSEVRPERFNTIAVKLARSAGVKIIPFALKTDFITRGRLIAECGPVHPENRICFEFGAPLPVIGNGRETQRQIIDFIAGRCRQWRRAAPVVSMPNRETPLFEPTPIR